MVSYLPRLYVTTDRLTVVQHVTDKCTDRWDQSHERLRAEAAGCPTEHIKRNRLHRRTVWLPPLDPDW